MKTLIALTNRTRTTPHTYLCEQDEVAHPATAEYKKTELDAHDGITVTYTYRCDAHTSDLTDFTRKDVESDTPDESACCGAPIDDYGYCSDCHEHAL